MKKNTRDLLYLILFSFILISVLANYNIIIESIRSSTLLWLTKLFGSLFPLMVIGNIIIKLNITKYTKNNSFTIMVLSCLSGFPSNAKYIKEMYSKKEISLEFANNALCYSFFANPLFIISTLSIILNKKLAITLLIIHYISNFIIYLILPKSNKAYTNTNNIVSLNDAIISSIKGGIDTMLLILGTISFYTIIITIIKKYLKFNSLIIIINGLLEYSSGLYALNNAFSLELRSYLAIIFICFGSLSIHTQIKSILKDTPINYHKFFIFRIIHSIIAIILLSLFFIITNF